MGKLLLLVAALFVGVAALRVLASVRLNRSKAAPEHNSNPDLAPDLAPDSKAAPHAQGERANKPPALLPCPVCGIHMPEHALVQHQRSQHP